MIPPTREEIAGCDLGELGALTTPVLARLYIARHEMVDHKLGAKLREILWLRLRTPLIAWPAWYGPNARRVPHWVGVEGLTRDHIVAFCPDAIDHNDMDHRPTFEMSIPGTGLDLVECTCGKRAERGALKRCQREGSRWVWPIEDVGGLSCFIVCRAARRVDDPAHAPAATGVTGAQCICGYTLDPEWLPSGEQLLRIPVRP